jgi:hypothetical protein
MLIVSKPNEFIEKTLENCRSNVFEDDIIQNLFKTRWKSIIKKE